MSVGHHSNGNDHTTTTTPTTTSSTSTRWSACLDQLLAVFQAFADAAHAIANDEHLQVGRYICR